MTNSLFFELPDQLKLLILDVWLELPNNHYKGIKDAAKVNRKYRTDLDQFLRSLDSIFQCDAKDDDYGCNYEWICSNGVTVRNLRLWSRHLEKESAKSHFLERVAPHLHKLHVNTVCTLDFDADDYNSEDETYDADRDSREFSTDGEIAAQQITTNHLLSDIFHTCPGLKKFSIAHKTKRTTWYTTLDSRFCDLFVKCTNLQVLHLDTCTDISAPIVTAMCTAPNLLQIVLDGDCSFADNALYNQPTTCSVKKVTSRCAKFSALFPLFKEVHLIKVAGPDIATLSQTCGHVKTATISLHTILRVADAERICHNWCSLRSLSFHESGRLITDNTITTFIKLRPSLTSLHFNSYLVSRHNKRFAVPECVYPVEYRGSQLRELYLDGGSEDILHTVLEHCPYLFALQLSHMERSTILNCLHLLNNSSVKLLRLRRIDALCDSHISSLRTIETLELYNVRSSALTVSGVVNMCRLCTTLRVLHLSYMNHMPGEVVLDIIQVCPTLHTVYYTFAHVKDFGVGMVGMVNRMLKQFYPDRKVMFLMQG